jgi:hypothetical protein
MDIPAANLVAWTRSPLLMASERPNEMTEPPIVGLVEALGNIHLSQLPHQCRSDTQIAGTAGRPARPLTDHYGRTLIAQRVSPQSTSR